MASDQPPGRPNSAPIPPSFYQRPAGGSPSGAPPPRRGLAWWRSIPGFRTGRRWKRVVAACGYLVMAVWIAQIGSNAALGVLGLLSLAAVWLATNAFGIRTKLPGFGSPNRLAASGAWAGLAIAMLVTAGAATPAPRSTNAGVGTGPSSPSTLAVAHANPPTPASPSPVASPTPSPTPSPKPSLVAPPTQAPVPPPAAFDFCGAPANPWHYNFCASDSGKYITSAPSGFCGYFSCISSFSAGSGYVVECNDGMYSRSGGISGACSRHGGVLRPLWA